jgi:hypothetical protein
MVLQELSNHFCPTEIGKQIPRPMGREGEAPSEPFRRKAEKRLGRSLALPPCT